MLEVLLHDAQCRLKSSFGWHRDDGTAEAGYSESGTMTRTVLFCWDPGCVDLEIAGWEPIVYHQMPGWPYTFVSMAPDVWHRSTSVDRPDLAGAVQRKMAVHMRQKENVSQRVDWLTVADAGK